MLRLQRFVPQSLLLLSLLPALALVPPPPAAAAVLVVDTDLDVEADDGLCSLREALHTANDDLVHADCGVGAGPDRITFDLPTPAIITLSDHLPAITAPLAIHGPGVLDLALDGATQYRPLEVDSPDDHGWTLVEDLSITNGRTPVASDWGGGGRIDAGEVVLLRRVRFIGNRAANGGGGLVLWNSTEAPSDLTLEHCLFADNVAEGPAGSGGLHVADGGGTVRVHGSTWTGNLAEHRNGSGGAARVRDARLLMDASTISGNHANSSGGGLSLEAGTGGAVSSARIRHVTITDNTSSADGTGLGGGGLKLSGSTISSLELSLQNTVVAQNVDLSGLAQEDLLCSGNLILLASDTSFIGSNESCDAWFPEGFPNADGAFVGTALLPLDAGLGALTDPGWLTPAHFPLNVTPPMLVDQGRCPGAVSDQRGFGQEATGLRITDHVVAPDGTHSDGCDIGAVELGARVMRPPAIFADGFEAGHTLLWSEEQP